jgi:beta-lactamase class A
MRRLPFRAVLVSLALTLAAAGGAQDPAPRPASPGPALGSAVVAEPVQDLYERPDETSPVDDQVILGERVEIREETAGFARVVTESGSEAWIPERAIRRDVPAAERLAEVVSPRAHLYATPSFTRSRPLLTAPLGARLAVEEELEREGHQWLRVRMPDGRRAFLAAPDAELVPPGPRPKQLDPARWIALARLFLGAPYTWGGTTPEGFDCSGLVHRVLKRHGVLTRRNSSQMCFQDPQLVPVPLDALRPGDLLFFGTEEKIDHEAIFIGDGKVLQATAYGVPSTQITVLSESPRLRSRFRYARRVVGLPDAPPQAGLDAARTAALKARVEALAREGKATFGVVFKDLTSGASFALNERKVFHAASTMKTPIMLELLRRVDAGELALEQEIAVTDEFPSLVDGSLFKLTLEAEQDREVAPKLGGKATLRLLMHEMIVRSSNLATNILLTFLGPAHVQGFTDALGAHTVRVRRCVEDGKAFEKGLNNETDAAGMAALMEAVIATDKLSERSKALAWDTLAAQYWNDQIPAGLHRQSGAVVAHKTGWISSARHDAAVVKLPDGRRYVLVLLATDFGANAEGDARVKETTRRMSRAVWEAMIAPSRGERVR